MIRYSCSIFLGEVLFPIKFAAGFIWVYYSIEVNDGKFVVSGFVFFFFFFSLSHSKSGLRASTYLLKV